MPPKLGDSAPKNGGGKNTKTSNKKKKFHPGRKLTMYSLLRSALFQLDPETAHHLTLGGLKTAYSLGLSGIIAPRPADDPRTVMGTDFSQSGRPRRRTRQEWRLHRRAGGTRFRLHRDRHRHPAAPARQPQAAPVPLAASQRHHQPHGLQQRRRGQADRERAARGLSRHIGHQHRQECRHAD